MVLVIVVVIGLSLELEVLEVVVLFLVAMVLVLERVMFLVVKVKGSVVAETGGSGGAALVTIIGGGKMEMEICGPVLGPEFGAWPTGCPLLLLFTMVILLLFAPLFCKLCSLAP